MRPTRIVALPLASLALAAVGRAEIGYRLTPQPDAKRVRVEITIPVKGDSTTIQMPRWNPGWYTLQNQTKDLKDLTVVDDAGSPVAPTVVDDHTWLIPGKNRGSVRVTYTLPADIDAGAWGINGPATYMYVVGRKEEGCRLNLDLPQGWRAAVGLPGNGPEYRAPNYDVLADNPITTGEYRESRYTVDGKEHILALSGKERNSVDGRELAKLLQTITETEGAFFGGLPYPKYVWHFGVGEGENWAGGLEHLSSTQIGFGQKIGWRTKSVFAHEFFHLWNVKRIRSAALGPFDYTKLPRTGALWWLEGVTDYYAGLMLRRGGIYDDPTYLNHILSTVKVQRANPARLEVSPYESSERVGDADGGKGNSTGYRVSYYDVGYLAGLVLDLEMRYRTNGRASLDDVEKALWQQYRADPSKGFEEGEIRRQLAALGGPAMGDLYDRIILKPGELPLETALSHVGLTLSRPMKEGPSIGFETREEGEKLVISEVIGASDLKVGDELLMTGANLFRARRDAVVGKVLDLKVRRDGKEVDVKQEIRSVPQPVWTLETDPNATPDELRLRAGWLSKNGKTAPVAKS